MEHKVIDLDLPLRKATIEDYNNAVREIAYYVNKNNDKEKFDFQDNARMHVYSGTIGRYRTQQFKEVVPIEYHVVRFGDVDFATNPFELFLDMVTILRQEVLQSRPLLFSFAAVYRGICLLKRLKRADITVIYFKRYCRPRRRRYSGKKYSYGN